MTTIVLLARNFVRQNRWLLLAFICWPFLLAAFVWSPHHAGNQAEIFEILQQEVFYGVAVVAFLASSAIYNEKRSRRIIGVLSKAVSRAQYLLGLLVGCGCFAIGYFLATGASVMWLLGYSSARLESCVVLLLHGCLASLWIATLSLLFSTFLYPFIAAAVAGAAAFAPLALSRPNVTLAPAAHLMESAGSLAATLAWQPVVSAVIESTAFLTLTIRIFASRDVTVSIE